MRLACKYGDDCYRKDPRHLEQFAHPGDRNYRIGLVVFKSGQQPQLKTLWDAFQFYDPDESGHLSQDEFSELLVGFVRSLLGAKTPTLEKAWEASGASHTGYLNFRAFAAWTQEHLGLEYPLGLEERSMSMRRCRFRRLSADGGRCSCEAYVAAVDSEDRALCRCGHKPSMHRSDFAQRTYSAVLKEVACSSWAPGVDGLVKVEDSGELDRLQAFMTASHKSTDNWTRDRGCGLHGVNGCQASCASRNRVRVPHGYLLVSAYRNQNQDLWTKYTIARTAIAEDCARPCKDPHETRGVACSGTLVTDELDKANNEWHLFHGTSPQRCKSICSTNFRLALAGSGATWKDAGKETGMPLYGFGIYLAERITKADEYSSPLPPETEQTPPVIPRDGDGEVFTTLLCRVMGGRTNLITTNEIEVDKLRKDVFEGSYNSVFGDREVSLGKPFREVVVYDKDQCYPEFLLVYRRVYE